MEDIDKGCGNCKFLGDCNKSEHISVCSDWEKQVLFHQENEFECSICGVVYPSENEAKSCCASRKDRKELDSQNRC